MAAEWIKMRNNLDTDWRIIEIATALEVPELHVVGMLWKVWSWADQHTVDGNAIRVTSVTLDRFTGVSGFCAALRTAGWLDGPDGALTLVNFTEHNGKTAKKRAETQKRVQRHRNAKSVTPVTQKALPEKRREEKNIHSYMRPEVEKLFQAFLEHVRLKTGQAVNEIQQDLLKMEVMRRGDSAEADLEFSIQKGAKTLLRATDDYQKLRADVERSRLKQPASKLVDVLADLRNL